MKKIQWLVSVTAIIAIIGVFLITGANSVAHAQKIDTSGQLHMGNPDSPVKVVLFIDFRCGACKRFENQTFPLIKRRYIDTGEIDYTVIPLAFLSGSERLGKGYFCTRAQNPTLSMAYIEQVYQSDDVPLLPGIDAEKLSQCIGSASASTYLERNRAIAEQAMGRKLYTPAVFVNGKKVPNPSYSDIAKAIDGALK